MSIDVSDLKPITDAIAELDAANAYDLNGRVVSATFAAWWLHIHTLGLKSGDLNRLVLAHVNAAEVARLFGKMAGNVAMRATRCPDGLACRSCGLDARERGRS